MSRKNNWAGWTLPMVEQLAAAGKIRGFRIMSKPQAPTPQATKEKAGKGGKKGHKYGAVEVYYEGKRFQSVKEATEYKKLLVLERAGAITDLRVQVPYELNAGGTYSLKYIADFVFIWRDTGIEEVRDAKGFRTREYKKKARLMRKVHGITIVEV